MRLTQRSRIETHVVCGSIHGEQNFCLSRLEAEGVDMKFFYCHRFVERTLMREEGDVVRRSGHSPRVTRLELGESAGALAPKLRS